MSDNSIHFQRRRAKTGGQPPYLSFDLLFFNLFPAPPPPPTPTTHTHSEYPSLLFRHNFTSRLLGPLPGARRRRQHRQRQRQAAARRRPGPLGRGPLQAPACCRGPLDRGPLQAPACCRRGPVDRGPLQAQPRCCRWCRFWDGGPLPAPALRIKKEDENRRTRRKRGNEKNKRKRKEERALSLLSRGLFLIFLLQKRRKKNVFSLSFHDPRYVEYPNGENVSGMCRCSGRETTPPLLLLFPWGGEITNSTAAEG